MKLESKIPTAAASSPTTTPATAVRMQLDSIHIRQLERFEARLESLLVDLRAYRAEQQLAVQDRGVLGTRGLTQFLIDILKSIHDTAAKTGAPLPIVAGLAIKPLMAQADRAGFALPSRRTLSKRLGERAYRVGDIAWHRGQTGTDGFWYWRG